MALEIALEKHSQLQVVSLRGRLDSAGAPALQSSLNELLSSGESSLLFECSELRYVSSVGLGIFVTSAKTVRASGGRICFSGLNSHVRSVFEMVGFLGIFEVYPSLEAALESPLAQDGRA
ncbi:MAG: STAS domain-containing protein [Bryobacteraceae bacterium]